MEYGIFLCGITKVHIEREKNVKKLNLKMTYLNFKMLKNFKIINTIIQF